MPKRRGRHPHQALSAVQVRQLKAPGRYADGNGLYLVVDPSGAKRWALRTVIRGKRRDLGLGGTLLISLSEAREKALLLRKRAREGGDPTLSAAPPAIVPTFAEAAERVFTQQKSSWKNEKHAAQWIASLRGYANPVLAQISVAAISTPDVLAVLTPIWLEKPETARRVRQRIGTVLDWAKAAGFRTGDNPVEGVARGLPKQNDVDKHHTALPYSEVSAFLQRLRNHNAGAVELAFEFLILTAARTGEVLGMKWSEVDLEGGVWTVPAERMKARKAHRVPLPSRCRELLRAAKSLGSESQYVFVGRSQLKPLSNMVFLMVLRRLGVDVTAHGFRSAFRDWASEQTNYPREVCEGALAHSIESKVEAAYRRGDLLEKRRALMQDWATYVS